MPLNRLLFASALYLAACAPAFAVNHPRRLTPADQPAGGVAWGLKPGLGQLGAAGFGYYRTENCWTREPTFDAFDNYLGNRRTNICVEMH
jgi:hypothetical protein